jgi:hypothetical protein
LDEEGLHVRVFSLNFKLVARRNATICRFVSSGTCEENFEVEMRVGIGFVGRVR